VRSRGESTVTLTRVGDVDDVSSGSTRTTPEPSWSGRNVLVAMSKRCTPESVAR
jgi:hypothetical protein